MLKPVYQAINDFFSAPTLDEIVAQELHSAQEEERQAEHVILTHRFQAYMARSRIDALKAWDDQQRKGVQKT